MPRAIQMSLDGGSRIMHRYMDAGVRAKQETRAENSAGTIIGWTGIQDKLLKVLLQ